MKLKLFIIIVFGLALFSCKKEKQTDHQKIKISGKLFSDEFKTIYLKQIDNFNYLTDDYIIDSTTVSFDGKFEFHLDSLPSNLMSLSTGNYKPASYIVLREFPDKYYYGSCARFLASEPTFYIKKNDSINIDWFDKEMDSVIHKTDLARNQNIMHKFYRNIAKNVAGHLDRENPLDYGTAWENVLKDQKKDLNRIDISKINDENSFDNYMYSEIVLYNLNGYLNWYENLYPEKVNSAIIKQNESDLYNQIFLKYLGHSWNQNSFEYYKFTERFVNYQMNIRSKSFNTYHVPSLEKRRLAEKVLSGKNKLRYLNILDTQIKNVL